MFPRNKVTSGSTVSAYSLTLNTCTQVIIRKPIIRKSRLKIRTRKIKTTHSQNPPKLTQNAYKAAKRNEYPCNMSRRVGRNLYETVCRQMQTN